MNLRYDEMTLNGPVIPVVEDVTVVDQQDMAAIGGRFGPQQVSSTLEHVKFVAFLDVLFYRLIEISNLAS